MKALHDKINDDVLDMEKLLELFPKDFIQTLSKKNKQHLPHEAQKKLNTLLNSLNQITENPKSNLEEIFNQIEKLAKEVGITTEEEPPIDFKEKTQNEIKEEMKKIRKGKNMIDFTFDDLFD